MDRDVREQLRTLAQQATSGPWEPEFNGKEWGPCSCCGEVLAGWSLLGSDHLLIAWGDDANSGITPGIHEEADARYIAAVSPDVLQGLLDHIDRLEAQRRLDASVEEVISKHLAELRMDTDEDNALLDEIRSLWSARLAGETPS